VGNGGESNRSPIFLELVGGVSKPTNPFKFNYVWLKDEGFINLVKDLLHPVESQNIGIPAMT
jgi:hypothetical protein